MLFFFSLPSHIITPCVSPSEVYVRAVTSARRHSKHCTLSLVWLCAQALLLTDEARWLYRACVYLTPLFTSWAMAASIRTASVFIRMTYIVKKKESLRKMLSFTFDLKRRGTNAMIHHRSIIFETKGVLFMVMPNPSLQCTAVKSFIYYNATFVSRYLFFFLSGQAIVKFLKGVNKTQQ